eukprot:TRINITY_DN592_c0_g1_i1.p1 TRINITY_DN592_c0_g1~~TRINITY_DN592_c0_g1_i1.p1  ORF type:complete len:472 (+),score=102.18 TRINITY_DN592_c0_g1_i1:171-1586(+)
MYVIAIALTCIAFAAYVLFAVAYRSGSSKTAPKSKVPGKSNNKRKLATKTKPVAAQPVSKKASQASKTAVKPKKELQVEEEEELVPIIMNNKPQAEQKKAPTSKQQAAQKQAPKKQIQVEKPTTDSLSDFEKLEGEEEILEDGWEVIARRKPKTADSELPAEDAEKSDSAEETTEKPKTAEKRKERGEGRRDRSDRPFEGDRKNRGDRKGGDNKRFLATQTAASQQPEKKKKPVQPAREVRVGNYIFSRLPPNAKPVPGQSSPFDTLSEAIDDHATSSDDTVPLKTAHLELRFYRAAPQPPKAKPGAVWEAMAKYNYTSTHKPANSDDEEGKEEGETEGESGSSEMPFAKEEELVDSFLRSLGGNFSKSLTKAHMEKGKPQRFLSPNDLAAAKQDLVKWLTHGTSQEPPVFSDNAEKANEFLDKVLSNFDQSSLRCFSIMGPRLWTRGFHDEGVFFFDQHRIGLFWFLGYD